MHRAISCFSAMRSTLLVLTFICMHLKCCGVVSLKQIFKYKLLYFDLYAHLSKAFIKKNCSIHISWARSVLWSEFLLHVKVFFSTSFRGIGREGWGYWAKSFAKLRSTLIWNNVVINCDKTQVRVLISTRYFLSVKYFLPCTVTVRSLIQSIILPKRTEIGYARTFSKIRSQLFWADSIDECRVKGFGSHFHSEVFPIRDVRCYLKKIIFNGKRLLSKYIICFDALLHLPMLIVTYWIPSLIILLK